MSAFGDRLQSTCAARAIANRTTPIRRDPATEMAASSTTPPSTRSMARLFVAITRKGPSADPRIIAARRTLNRGSRPTVTVSMPLHPGASQVDTPCGLTYEHAPRDHALSRGPPELPDVLEDLPPAGAGGARARCGSGATRR